jgi:hypothetical protein
LAGGVLDTSESEGGFALELIAPDGDASPAGARIEIPNAAAIASSDRANRGVGRPLNRQIFIGVTRQSAQHLNWDNPNS